MLEMTNQIPLNPPFSKGEVMKPAVNLQDDSVFIKKMNSIEKVESGVIFNDPQTYRNYYGRQQPLGKTARRARR